MKKIYLLFIFSCLSIAAFGQIPIAYWSFEDATHAVQSLAVTDQITGANGAAGFNVTAAGGIGTTSVAGAGAALWGGAAGLGINSGAVFTVANPTTAATKYWEFKFTNTATTGNVVLSIDAMTSVAGLAMGILTSTDGGATYSYLTGIALSTSWANKTYATIPYLPSGTNAIRIYGYNSTTASMTIDNLMILAGATATGVSFTTADEADIYNMFTSGGTGQYSRNGFTDQGVGTNVTINNNSATSGVSMSAVGGAAFNVLVGATVTLGNTGTISGPGGFAIANGATIVTANTQGIAAVGTASGCILTTNYRTYTQGATYVYNGTAPQITGNGVSILALIGGYAGAVTIDNNSGVTMTQPLTFNSGTNLNLETGTLVNTSSNLIMNNGSNVNVDNGTLAVLPTSNYPSGVGSLFLNYVNLGVNNLAFTTGNEWPNPLSATVTVNKPLATITLNSNKVLIGTGSVILTAGTLDATASNYNLTLVGVWTNNSSTSAFTARGGTVTFNGGTAKTWGGTFTTTFNNFTLNSTSYLTLGNTENVFGTLTLSSGYMVIGANNLVLGIATPPVAGTPSSSSLVVATSTGEVQKLMTANGTFLYPVGDTASPGPNYTPITLNFSAGTYGGGAYAGVNLRNTKHPNNANTTNYTKRYWSVALSAITAPAYVVTATYVPGDVVGIEANIFMGQYTGALPWILFGPTNTATHTLTTTSTVSNLSSDFSGINGGGPTAGVSASTGICTGGSTTLSAATSLGDPTLTYAWAPSASLSASTGVSVTASPTITTTYTMTVTDGNGLTATATTTVSVNPNPTAITGTPNMCVGLTTTLNSTPAGGTWSSSNGNATVGSSSGVVTGVTAGTSTITYTIAGVCFVTTPVTVNPNPTAITGTTSVCMGATTTLNSTPAGGTWSSSNGNTTVGASTGVVTGVAQGTSTITYTLSTGCINTTTVTVYPNPTIITGTTNVCVGLTTSLNSTPAGGTWSSSNGNATIGSSTGVVTGSIAGTSTITYTIGGICTITTPVTVNPNPTAITGTLSVCVGLTTTLNSTPAGGTWSSSNGNATIGSSTGVVTGITAGTSTITYTLSTGCINTTVVTVNSNPTTITGTLNVCVGLTTTLNSTPAGGTWSSSNGNASVGSSTGVVTGVTAGTSIITYTVGTGCIITTIVTVNPNPVITGTTAVCVGLTTTLNGTPAGGAWSSSNTAVGTIDPVTGILTGLTSGTTTVTDILGTGCLSTTTVTVNPNPTTITGTLNVCVGLTTTLNSTPAGGTWTTSNGNTTIGSSTGVVGGLIPGTSTITYTLSTGCINTTIVTVNPNPTAITGTLTVCVGLTTTLNSTPAGGTWSSSNGNATVGSSTGVVTGMVGGTSVITYMLSTGCINTAIVTVNPNPTTITGTLSVCIGLTTTLNSTPAGGTWSSSNGNATIGSSTGVVTGVTQGTSVITYTLSTGCINTAIVTVNPLPTTITGMLTVCVGLTTTLNSTPAGGTWSSSNGNATVGSSTGVVTGVIAGTSIITYTISTGCINTIIVTVNPNPTTITGGLTVCIGLTTTLNSTPAGGTWTSSNGNATIGSSTGVVTGVTQGTSVITYTISTGCINTAIVTVDPNPTTITGTLNVCVGLTTTLNSTPAGGTWSSSNGNATVGSLTGVVTGMIAGTSIITYTIGTGCIITTIVTINPNPTTITGTLNVCVGLTTTLNSTPAGGIWASSNGNSTIGTSTGVVTGIVAGTSIITYTINTGCINTAIVTVNPNPTVITGTLNVCVGLTTSLNSTPAGGTWSSSNGNVTVGVTTGIIGGLIPGTSVITYTLSTGCINTAIVTINPNPTPITGTLSVCVGLTTTLNSTPAGGTWSSSNGNATVGSSTGIVTGIAGGTSVITYMLSTGCINTAVVTVNPNPTTITGTLSVCIGLTTTLNSTPAGGTWTSSNGNATIGSSTGVVTGITQGTSVITYALSTGCINTNIVTVNSNPTAITGTLNVCVGLTTTLNSTPAGGTWSSSNGNATIGSSTGVVTGIAGGTSVITYMLSTGCINTAIVTVNPNPTAITGTLSVCIGLTTTLNSTPAGGTWTSSNGNATIGSSTGVVTGITAGTSTITYTLNTGCINTAIVTVNSLPTTITGTLNVCVGLTTSLNSTPAGGTWSSSNGNAIVGSSTGVVIGSIAGTSIITYALGTSCINTAIVTVNPNPTTITGALSICVGGTTTLNSTPAGGLWNSSNGNATIAASTGIVTGVIPGTSTITYTLPTGCINTAIVTVNANPTTITGTFNVCVGLTTTLNSTPAGGTWSSSNSNASVGIFSGVVTGIIPGTSTITYTIGTTCFITATVTVNPLPTSINGTPSVCVGLTTQLTDATAGGAWSSSNGNATIGTGGLVTGVTGGTSIITYTLPTGCIATAIVTVNPLPGAIMGTLTVCSGLTTSLSDIPGGGTWTSSNTAIATVGSATGIVTGGSVAVTSTATITYTLSTGCIMTAVVTVNPLPAPITGGLTVCVGLTTALTDATAGGTWSASNGNVAVGTSGIVTGILAGTSIITYTLPTSCIETVVVTVNPLPGAIMGTLTVCSGLTTSLSDTPPSGTWTSSATGIATVDPVTGIVTGGSVLVTSTATITYTISTGCIMTAVVTVNPLPTAILGTLTVCSGSTTLLSDATAGGTWSSSSTAIATVGSSTGLVTGGIVATTSTATITYALSSTGCLITAVVTVNPLPAVITGTMAICVGATTTLSDATTGGTWSSSNGNATVNPVTGLVTGAIPGTSTITYTISTGCYVTATMTINANPTNITGTLSVCVGVTTTLNSTPAGGTWSTSNSNATIGLSSGIATGLNAGTSVITYTIGTTCSTTAVLTVYPLPTPIIGLLNVCVGLTTSLTDAGAGTWSAANGNAGIGTTGIVTGIIAGTDVITYTLPTGCYTTSVVTVDPLPGTIMGTLTVCSGSTTSLSDTPAGGEWSSSAPGIAFVNPVTGLVIGGVVATTSTATITYTVATGCIKTTIVTVNPLPAAITGVMTVCVGLTTSLTDAGGGTWSASNGNAIVGTSGIVAGITAGTDVITYTLPTGCIATAIVTVNPLPGAIMGTLTVCSGLTTSLSDTPPGGAWSSSAPGIASVDPVTGVVTGGSVLVTSTATITYTIGTGCIMTTVVTVNPLPTAILGTLSVCIASTTSLTDATPGGTWSSSNPSIATVVAGTGLVTGWTVGTAIITYTLSSTGCIITSVVTVNPLPTAILGTLSVCAGATTSLSDASTGGAWSSSASGIASVDPVTGIVTGGPVAVVSTATITYTLPTTCITTAIVTVYPIPATILGTRNFCAGVTSILTDATPGGTWTSSDIYVATVGYSSGAVFGWSAGTVFISYTLPSGCFNTTVVTVNPLPPAILGDLSVCQGLTTALSDAAPSGTWSIAPPGIALISATGVVTGTSAGTTLVTYTLPVTGCAITAPVTVNPLPVNISGATNVCLGLTTTLTDATVGGIWTSSNPLIVSVGLTTGVVTGVAAGTAMITYTLGTGCITTTIVTVNPLPTPILGSLSVCVTLTTSLSDAGGGTWSMSNGNATINASGTVTGVLSGLDTVTYTLPTGCIITATVTVYALPSAISGTLSVCAGLTTSLSDVPAGGIWSSSATTIASIGSTTGLVTGEAVLTTGTTTITYNLATGCNAYAIVTVNPLPTTITGIMKVCIGYATTLNSTPAGGTWSSSNTGVGTVSSGTGVVEGITPGTTTITYTLPTGCITTTIVTVTPQPSPISGMSNICIGAMADFTDGTPGGIWMSSNSAIATVGTSGVVTGVGTGSGVGTATISYILSVGCDVLFPVTINPLPTIDTLKGGGNYCEGGSGVDIWLTGSSVGVSYLLYYGPSVTGYMAGTGDSLNFGLHTVAGVYTVQAVNSTTGCTSNMFGSVTVTISPTINPTVRISSSRGDTVCPGTSVTFTPIPDSGGTAPTYQWSVNGVFVSTASTYTFIPADGDVITVIMTSNAHCVMPLTARDTLKIHVIPDGAPSVTITAFPGDTACQYEAVTYYATGTFGGPSPTFLWFVDGSHVTTGPEFRFYPVSGDVVYCKMVSDYLCRSFDTGYSNVITMTTEPMIIPHVDIVSSLGFDITVGEYDTLRTVVTHAGPHPTYQWEINGTPVIGATADTFVSTFNDYDSVTCLVTSSGYCEGITTFAWIYITVHQLGVQQYTVGSGDIKLIPNPNKGLFTIKGTLGTLADEEVWVDITDMMGQVVYRNKVMAVGGKLDEQIKLNNTMPNGMYLLNLQSGDDRKSFHFVIEQ